MADPLSDYERGYADAYQVIADIMEKNALLVVGYDESLPSESLTRIVRFLRNAELVLRRKSS